MSKHAVTLPIPNHVYDRAHRIAQERSISVEAVMLRQLEEAFAEPLPRLPAGEQHELDALVRLCDDALWTIARERLPKGRQTRMATLMDENSRGQLDRVHRLELEELVQQGQRLSLRKAQAAALLTERGHAVSPEEMLSAGE